MVELTFDDGPDPEWTPRVVAALGDTRGTFFVMGSAAARHPGVVRATLEAGHAIQLHCHEHTRHTELTREELEADTDRALAVLAGLGVAPTRWRTPWGVHAPFTADVAAARGLALVHWTADTEDWDGAPAAVLLERLAGRLGPDAIVLAHDGIGPGARRTDCAETVALLPDLLAAIDATPAGAGGRTC